MAHAGVAIGFSAGVKAGQFLPPNSHVSLTVEDGGLSAVSLALPRLKPRSVKLSSATVSKSFSGQRVSWTLSRSSVKVNCVRAQASDNGESKKSIAPLEPQSPTGQFLVSVLRSHPHLFPAAADQQLERLAADREAADQPEQPSTSGTDLTLYKYAYLSLRTGFESWFVDDRCGMTE